MQMMMSLQDDAGHVLETLFEELRNRPALAWIWTDKITVKVSHAGHSFREHCWHLLAWLLASPALERDSKFHFQSGSYKQPIILALSELEGRLEDYL